MENFDNKEAEKDKCIRNKAEKCCSKCQKKNREYGKQGNKIQCRWKRVISEG